MHILHDEITQILDKLKDIVYTEWVELPETAAVKFGGPIGGKEKADYRQLLEMLKIGQSIYVARSGIQYNLFKILGGIMTDKTLKKEVGDSFNISGDKIIINQGKIDNLTMDGNVQIMKAKDDLVAELQTLIRSIKIEAEDGEDKSKSIRELEVLGEDVEKASGGNESEKKLAWQ